MDLLPSMLNLVRNTREIPKNAKSLPAKVVEATRVAFLSRLSASVRRLNPCNIIMALSFRLSCGEIGYHLLPAIREVICTLSRLLRMLNPEPLLYKLNVLVFPT